MLPPDEIQPRGDRARREHGEAFMPQAQLDEVDDARLVVNHDDSRELLVGRWHGWIGRRREQRRKRLGPPAPAGRCRRFRWREATTLADHGSRVRWTPGRARRADGAAASLSLIHISEPTRLGMISYAVFCL